MKDLIVYEQSATGWGACAPDLPGLGAAGKTLDEVKHLVSARRLSFTWKECPHTAIPFLRPAR
jgi:hypothetical protein